MDVRSTLVRSTLVRSTTTFWDLDMLFGRISREIMLFPGHMGGKKPTQSGNEDLSTEISDDTLLKCQGLWLEFTAVAHYTLAIGHLLSETVCLLS